MKFDELKLEQQQLSDSSEQRAEELMRRMRAQAMSFDRATRMRTWIGVAMFLLPVPLVLFVFEIAPQQSLVLKLIETVLVIFLLFCAGIVMTNGLLWNKSTVKSLPVRAFLHEQLRKSDRQAWLFAQLKLWFWAPLLVGWVIFVGAFLTGYIQVGLFSVLNLVATPLLAYLGIRSSHRYFEENILPWQRSYRDALEALGE